ncbi:serine/arginine repetitive matrix protein 1 [Monodelphis domestica]|uniref:serine/arginine repetitive matrix protein 1 n=1 Tax=Monodelphis domestica TaxID=13616 RepID=UPI0000F2E189|nr:serine/arginine repetitive matrix protein 1 [Monodelphis domestica]
MATVRLQRRSSRPPIHSALSQGSDSRSSGRGRRGPAVNGKLPSCGPESEGARGARSGSGSARPKFPRKRPAGRTKAAPAAAAAAAAGCPPPLAPRRSASTCSQPSLFSVQPGRHCLRAASDVGGGGSRRGESHWASASGRHLSLGPKFLSTRLAARTSTGLFKLASRHDPPPPPPSYCKGWRRAGQPPTKLRAERGGSTCRAPRGYSTLQEKPQVSELRGSHGAAARADRAPRSWAKSACSRTAAHSLPGPRRGPAAAHPHTETRAPGPPHRHNSRRSAGPSQTRPRGPVGRSVQPPSRRGNHCHLPGESANSGGPSLLLLPQPPNKSPQRPGAPRTWGPSARGAAPDTKLPARKAGARRSGEERTRTASLGKPLSPEPGAPLTHLRARLSSLSPRAPCKPRRPPSARASYSVRRYTLSRNQQALPRTGKG